MCSVSVCGSTSSFGFSDVTSWPHAQVITDRLIGIKEQSHAMRACEWANSKLVTDVGNRHLAETKKIAAELEQENREMMLLRKSRMREFLKAEAEVFEEQVGATPRLPLRHTPPAPHPRREAAPLMFTVHHYACFDL
jgi:hypothetical protein